ncbi:TonB-dependent receptor [Spirosoma utsteinense]|uniref:Iron complex outermembrane receptor protein n=1 Tax=Spirosoma utsteinense TaxID=2585773 RepID=A0ABR6W3J6_9BACT|nr:TonB-dependent receptor [Spirosoma utsteinense]MBC3784809.1 iron complex outermembrane receptor protein [Spirosoma utsteinense]MBC3791154.1 iron complex outermembrane receptor protein [Spirosoma utsteinense]
MKKATTCFFLLIAALWLSATPVQAQFSLSGTVRDVDEPATSGSALPGAAITIEGTYIGTFTDASGAFRLTNLKPGSIVVRVSLLGYESQTQTLDLTQNATLPVLLKKSAIAVDEVVVSATRANQKSAIAYTDVSRRDLDKLNLGQDIPQLLNFTPSIVTTSDAGAGVGYTGIRIRGSDATRVNVTLNGIPYNDAESQGTFFVNMPDFASSVSSIQIQRGVGTSTNGAGAFGASVNIQTNKLEAKPYAEVNLSAGSFGTRKVNVMAGTGLLNNHFVLDARLSKINSDGYVDRAFSDLKSFYLSGGYYTDKSFIRLNVFSGQEQTYQSWGGVPESLLRTNRTYNVYTYDNETDNYQQDNYQLIASHELSRNWRLNTSFFYTKGRGYYEQYRDNDRFSNYGLPNVVIGDSTIERTDIVRRRWLDNDYYGTVFSLDYNSFGKLTANIGGGWNQYKGGHFGEIIWARVAGNTTIRDRYYDDNATKNDFNLYAKAFYQFNAKLNGFADMQVRTVNYSFLGFNSQLQNVQQSADLTFFNPKAGLTYVLNDRSTVYASVGVGNREPNRDDYTQSTPQSRPRAERLIDYEAGYKIQSSRLAFTANAYYMNYRNQLVLSGRLNDVGAANRVNIPISYRAGVELEAGARLAKKLRWNVNATFSQNKVRNFTEYLDNFDNGSQESRDYRETDISFSPNVIGGSQLLFTPAKGLELGLLSKYVSKQYLDNTSNESRSLDAYFTNDIRIIYAIKPRFAQEITFTLLFNNVLNELYESNGYTYAYISEGKVTADNGYYPQAGRNFLAGVRLRF